MKNKKINEYHKQRLLELEEIKYYESFKFQPIKATGFENSVDKNIDYPKLSEDIHIVKIADVHDTENNNLKKYFVSDKDNNIFSVVSSAINIINKTDYLFFPANTVFPDVNRNNIIISALREYKTEIDGLIVPLLYFTELNPDYEYRISDIAVILKINLQ